MKVNIEELITINYEIEGLLYLAMHRGAETPVQVWDMIRDKIDTLRENIDIPEKVTEEEIVSLNTSIDLPEEKCILSEDNINTVSIKEKLTPDCVETCTDEDINNEYYAPKTDAPTIDTSSEQKIEVEIEVATESSEAAPEIENENKAVEETPEEIKPEAIIDQSDTISTEALRLDEKLARQNSRDLRKAFSLNDRFRFRRELFGNSDAKMNDTINLVEAMLNRDEAYDYFYNDLEWDRENQEVSDFMAIIEKHFTNK